MEQSTINYGHGVAGAVHAGIPRGPFTREHASWLHESQFAGLAIVSNQKPETAGWRVQHADIR